MVWPTINKCLDYIHRNSVDKKCIKKFLSSPEDYAVHCRAFLGWLLNDSHFRAAFMTNDIQDAFSNGIEVDLDAPIYVVQPALIMMRRMYEFPEKVSTWFHLVERGVHPRGAAMIVDSVNKSTYRLAPGFMFNQDQGGHYAFKSTFSTFKSIENISSDPVVLNYDNIGSYERSVNREDETYRRGYVGCPAMVYSNLPRPERDVISKEITKNSPVCSKANPPHTAEVESWSETINLLYYKDLDEVTKDIMRILEENFDSDSPVFTGVTSDQDGVETGKESAIAA
jgi:hypothetical protein